MGQGRHTLRSVSDPVYPPLCAAALHRPKCFQKSLKLQVRYLCHVMRQAESSRDTVQRRKNSCLRDAFMFLLWHPSRHEPMAVIGGRCRSRADNLQPGTVEAGRVTPCAQEQLA